MTSHSIRITKSNYDRVFLFHDSRDKKFVYAFYANVPCIYYEPAYFYSQGIFSCDTKDYGTVSFDQFDKFIKRLSFLSVAIMGLIKSNTNNTENNFFIFQLKEQNHAVKIIRLNFNTKFITLVNQDIHEIVGDNIIIPYTKQLNGYINQYFTEVNKTMNEWLHLN